MSSHFYHKLLMLLTVTGFFCGYAQQAQTQNSELQGFDPQTRIYIVRPGDTMWDISNKAYQDPWKWPRVWENNPSVQNPHLIYPDNQLVLPTTDGIAPRPIEVAEFQVNPKPETPITQTQAQTDTENSSGAPTMLQTEEPLAETSELVEPSIDDLQDGSLILKDDAEQASVSRLALEEKPAKPIMAARQVVVRLGAEGVLLTEENRVKMSIIGDETARSIFAKGDKVYLSKGANAGIEVGAKYYTYSKIDQLKHPLTKEPLGVLVRITGILQVVEVSKRSSTAVVVANFDTVEKSNSLMTYADKQNLIVPLYASESRSGVIVRANDNLQTVAAFQVVYIDLGSRDGIETGTMLKIYRDLGERYDSTHKEYTELPRLNLGLGVVLDAGERASTMLIVKSRQEIVNGDRVETVLGGG